MREAKHIQNQRQTDNGRIIWADFLRIVAVFCMILLHVTALKWDSVAVDSFEWQIFNVYDSIVRYCVPVFIMISGMFFLNPQRQYTLKRIITKNAFRLFTAFVFWSFCYTVMEYVIRDGEIGTRALIKSFVQGRYHLWFCVMMIGLYLIVPFLKRICEDKHLVEYFLILSFVLNILVNGVLLIPHVSTLMSAVMVNLQLSFMLGYTIYFVLGHYLAYYNQGERFNRTVYILGIVSLLFTIIATSLFSVHKGSSYTFYGYLLPNTFFWSLAVFIFFKEKVSKLNGVSNQRS